MLIYSCSIKIHPLGFNELLENMFCLLLVVKVFSLQKVVKILEEMVQEASWPEVRWIWQMRQSFVDRFIQHLKHWLCNVRSSDVWRIGSFLLTMLTAGTVVLEHFISLLSLLLRCNGFTRIQKAIMDQTGSRPPNSDHAFLWCKFGLGKCFGASFQSNHWGGCHQL